MALAMGTGTQEHVLILSGLSSPPALALVWFSLSDTIIGPKQRCGFLQKVRAAGELSGNRADLALPAASQSSQHTWEQIPDPEVLMRLSSTPALCSPVLLRRSCIHP